ncbi:MAG TPA: hypothetical protein DCY80_13645 [Solibacterales bacterium]|nr:hypothetical protein [Bryobacterales bacterium]
MERCTSEWKVVATSIYREEAGDKRRTRRRFHPTGVDPGQDRAVFAGLLSRECRMSGWSGMEYDPQWE